MAKAGWMMGWICASMLALGSLHAQAVVTKPASAPTSAQTVSPAAQKMVREAIAKLAPKATVDSVAVSALPGFYEVIASGQLLYASADGKFLLNGDLFDLTSMRNVSEGAWAKFRQRQLAAVPASARIIYAPAKPRYTVTVFTDISCSFCRALHADMGALNAAGIAVEYLAWPREGLTTSSGQPTPIYTQMVSVWCASDRKAAFDDAMRGKVKPKTCNSPVQSQFELGLKVGINGTPSIIGPDGRILGGYLTPEQLLQALRAGS